MKKIKINVYQIIAVLLALLAWCIIAVQENPGQTKTFTVNIDMQNMTEEYAATDIDYQQIKVKLEGTEDVISGIEPKDINASIDFSGIETGSHILPVDIDAPRGSIILEPKNPTVKVVIEKKKTEAFEVFVDVGNLNVPEGYHAMEAVATPGIVYLIGKEEYISQVDKVFVMLNVSNLSETYTQSLPVKVMDKQGNNINNYFTVTPSNIDVVVPIVADLPEKAVGVEAVLKGSPADGFVVSQVITEPSVVLIRGEHKYIDPFYTVMTEDIDLTDAASDIVQTVKLKMPEGADFGDTDEVAVFISIEPLQTVVFRELPVTVLNKPDNVEVGVGGTVDVRVQGIASLLINLQPDILSVTVDVASLKPGEYILPVKTVFSHNSPPGLSVIDYQQEIRVTVKNKKAK